ncbi:MAG: DUF1822 family protein [Scytolyngbya sp. HA4215-MV1]|nr:DUF1822 family protein [Scytolyngbya sp. HA4215-MV1]
MLTLRQLIEIYPESLWCAIASDDQLAAAQTEQHPYSHDGARWRAYLNTLCLQCLQRELPIALDVQAPLHTATIDLPQRWELVTGLPLKMEEVNLVVIPSDAITLEELRVPSEWVDIETWAVPYYVACQLDLDDHWLRIIGYATHPQIKQGYYDVGDRTYSLPISNLNENLSTIWLLRDYYPDPQPIVTSLPLLPSDQIAALHHHFSQPLPHSPRLLSQDTDKAFTDWLSFIADPARLQQLYRARTQSETQTLTATDLQSQITLPTEGEADRSSDSFVEMKRKVSEIFGEGWSLLSELTNPPTFTAAIVARSGQSKRAEISPAGKKIILNGQEFNLAIYYDTPTDLETAPEINADIKVNSSEAQVTLPAGLTLTIRDAQRNLIDGDRAIPGASLECLQACIIGSPNEEYIVELSTAEEPTPKTEHLRFPE